MPFLFGKNTGEYIHNYSYGLPANPEYSIETDLLNELNKLSLSSLSSIIISTDYGENYIVIPVEDNYLIAGPSRFTDPNSSQLTCMNKSQLSHVASLITFMLTGQMVDATVFAEDISYLEIGVHTNQQVDIALIHQRQDGVFHMDIRFEK